MNSFLFANPEYGYLLLLLPALSIWYVLQHQKRNTHLQIASFNELSIKSWKSKGRHLLFVFRILAIGFLTIALMRPQTAASWEDVTAEGIDIVLSMDISGSMLAQDLKPNRLEASKEVAMNFISGRPNDRIGLVIFSGESFTQCPLTTDHKVLQNLFQDVKSGMIQDGTAIGMGLATAISRLKNSEALSKVVILLTDGVNNQGAIAPLTAAEIAQQFDVRVYTIGVGTKGYAPFPFQTAFGTTVYQDVEVNIDEETLQNIATATGGKYFRATSNEALTTIYQEIDQLERSKIEVKEFSRKNEEFFVFALIGLLLLLIEFSLRHTLLKSIT